MKKTHINSKIIQIHSSSNAAKELLKYDNNASSDIILQIEPVEHDNYDFIVEVVRKMDYDKSNCIKSTLDTIERALTDEKLNEHEKIEIIEHQIKNMHVTLDYYNKI